MWQSSYSQTNARQNQLNQVLSKKMFWLSKVCSFAFTLLVNALVIDFVAASHTQNLLYIRQEETLEILKLRNIISSKLTLTLN